MHRLEHRGEGARGIDVRARRQADTAGDRGGLIGQDVAEQIVGHHDVESGRVGDQVNRRGIHMQIVGGHARVLGGDLGEDPLPQAPGVDQHVVLVNHRQMTPATRRQVEGVTHHALDPHGRVDAHLGGHLIGGAVAQRAAIARIQSLGAFAHHDEIGQALVEDCVRQGADHARIHLRRAQVDVLIEGEPQPQQQPALQQTAGDRGTARRRAHRAENDRLRLGELGEGLVIEDLTGRQPVVGAQIVVAELEGVLTHRGLQHLEGLGDDFGTDTVPGNHGNGRTQSLSSHVSNSNGRSEIRPGDLRPRCAPAG